MENKFGKIIKAAALAGALTVSSHELAVANNLPKNISKTPIKTTEKKPVNPENIFDSEVYLNEKIIELDPLLKNINKLEMPEKTPLDFVAQEELKLKELLAENPFLIRAFSITPQDPSYKDFLSRKEKEEERVDRQMDSYTQNFLINRTLRVYLQDLRTEIENYKKLQKEGAKDSKITLQKSKIYNLLLRTSAQFEIAQERFPNHNSAFALQKPEN